MCRINRHFNQADVSDNDQFWPFTSSNRRKCSFFVPFGTKTVFFFVKWKWQKMDGGRCRPTGGAVDPMLEPPVTVTDMQAVTGRNSCHSWWKTSDLLPLLWVNYVAFWKQLQSHHTRWVATVFGLNPLAKVPKQSFYTPSGSIWIVFLVLWFSKFL